MISQLSRKMSAFIEKIYSEKIVLDTGPIPLTLSLINRKNLFLQLIKIRNLVKELVGLSMFLKIKIAIIIQLYHIGERDLSETKSKLGSKLEDIEFDNLNFDTKLRIQFLLCLYGFPSLAYELRKKMISNIHQFGFEFTISNLDKIYIESEIFGFETKIEPDPGLIFQDPDADYLFRLLTNSSYELDARNNLNRNRLGFDLIAKLVSGKRVAIVGPAVPESELGAEIDMFDVIIRFNASTIPDDVVKFIGSRTDISFESYNNERKAEDFAEKTESVSKAIWSQSHIDLDLKIPFLWQTDFKHKIWFNGAPFGVLRAILELLPLNPKEIKVFNADFGTALTPYDKSYDNSFLPNGIPWIVWYWSGVGGHDFLLNFLTLKKLYLNGLFKGDQRFIRIMKSSPHEFSAFYEENYESRIYKKTVFQNV